MHMTHINFEKLLAFQEGNPLLSIVLRKSILPTEKHTSHMMHNS